MKALQAKMTPLRSKDDPVPIFNVCKSYFLTWYFMWEEEQWLSSFHGNNWSLILAFMNGSAWKCLNIVPVCSTAPITRNCLLPLYFSLKYPDSVRRMWSNGAWPKSAQKCYNSEANIAWRQFPFVLIFPECVSKAWQAELPASQISKWTSWLRYVKEHTWTRL